VALPDFQPVQVFVFDLMSRELSADLHYHNIGHTRSVVHAASCLALSEGLDAEQLLLVKTAALFHDLGFVKRYHSNEELGADMAREFLPRFGFKKDQIEEIATVIMATRLPQRPTTLNQRILCDADLNHLGLDIYLRQCTALFEELQHHGQALAWQDWLADSLLFLKQHKYHTASARALRDSEKMLNIWRLEQSIQSGATSP